MEGKRYEGRIHWATVLKAFMQKLTPKDDAGMYSPFEISTRNVANPRLHTEIEIPKENYVISKPVFFAACLKDAPCVASENVATIQATCPAATIVEFDTDHWVLDAAPQKVNEEVLKWLESLKLWGFTR